MPERRQRSISKCSKADKKLKKPNKSTKYEEQIEGGDDLKEEFKIKEFIESSCSNFRHLLMKSLLPNSVSNMDGVDNRVKGKWISNISTSSRKNERPDLVVVSFLNEQHKQNDEITLAIERLQKNGVTCAFFTMDDMRNGKNKPYPKLSNGHLQESQLLVPNGSENSAKLELEEENSANTNKNLTSNSVQSCNTLTSSDKTFLPADSEPSNLSQEEDQAPCQAPIAIKRRRKKRRQFYWPRKIVKNKIRNQIIQAKDTKESEMTKIPETLNGHSVLQCSINGTAKETITTLKVDSSILKLKPISTNTDVSTEECIFSKNNQETSNLGISLPVKIPLGKGIKVDLEPLKDSLHTETNLKLQQSIFIKRRKKQYPIEESLAKFCIGDRATKSVATERIKRCFAEESKKPLKHAPLDNESSRVVKKAVALVEDRGSERARNGIRSVEQQPILLSNHVNELNKSESISSRVRVNVSNLGLEKTLPSDTTPRKRTRRSCLSPDITLDYLASKKGKIKKTSLKFSPDITDSCKVTMPRIGSLFGDLPTSPNSKVQTVTINESKRPSTVQSLQVDTIALEVNDVVSELIESVIDKLQAENVSLGKDEILPDVAQNDVNSFAVSLGLLAVNVTKINAEDTADGADGATNSNLLSVAVKSDHCSTDLASKHNLSNLTYSGDSLPDLSMQLRRSSFFSLIAGNVRTNLENYLDGRLSNGLHASKRRRVPKNGFLLHHGDNCPEDPESAYKFHLATQVLLKLNRRRSKCVTREERTKTLLSYLKLAPKRSVRMGKGLTKSSELQSAESKGPGVSTFSGDWTSPRKYICGVCGNEELTFWDMVTHKGELHPGSVVTHVELPKTQDQPLSLIRKRPSLEAAIGSSSNTCTKCSTTFNNFPELHRHIFECAGNSSWLVDKLSYKRKQKKRRRGFKRRLSSTPKKPKKVESQLQKRVLAQPIKCTFCEREFKTEGWLKNHIVATHSLPVSIPLNKLPKPLPVRAYLRKSKS